MIHVEVDTFQDFFSDEAFSTCPYDSKPSPILKDTINNVSNLENEIQSISGDMNGQGRFTLKNEDYFEGFFSAIGTKNFKLELTVTKPTLLFR